MKKLRYEDIVDIIYGATLMGGGGGGSMSGGKNMLDGYAATHGGKDAISLDMCTPDEMADGAYAAVTAGMGAPTKIPADFSPWVLNAFNFYKYVQAYQDRQIKYSMAVEMGGFNTFVPMLVSLENNIPFLDVDGAARAVPALPTLILSVNGYDTLPIVLADYRKGSADYDKVLIDFPAEAKNAALGEDAARAYLAKYMDGIAGLCGWMTSKAKFDPKRLPYGSVTLAQKIGNVIRTTPAEKVFDALQSLITCKGMLNYVVASGDNGAAGGFDKGFVLFQKADGSPDYYRIDFQNENLVLYHGSAPDNMDAAPVMTAPDIICSFRADDNTPLTNADYFDSSGKVKKGLEVMLGLIQVSDVWWFSGFDKVNAIWKEFFANVGYAGDIVRFSAVK
jgi:DUF917 family protein